MTRSRGDARPAPATRWPAIAAVLLVGVAGCGGEPAPPVAGTTPPAFPSIIEPPLKTAYSATVQNVVDVRTVRLSDGEEVRVKGLAAPDACWADASTTFAKTMLLEKPVERTPDGEPVVSLRLADGTDYALLAVEMGMTRSENPDDRAMREAEESASAKRLGRWGPPCVAPSSAPPPAPTAPAPSTPAAPKPVTGCSVAYVVTHTWPGGFRTDVTLRNTGAAEIHGWTLRWTFAGGQTVSEMWNATQRQTGGDVAATAVPYNVAIPAGESVLMGFTASGSSTTPRAFTLNGHACSLA
ncbi:cellulose binding domain-containing protein [Lentzea sp. BCCO 10_0798]|uniref:Cellulose binding domain-containing protein n=1 Tax=Lentzea kristufekii TaxID=3095430 RepID=A0ABU4TTW4_9PSEU|nr:cellulose binding domain-containing protein [Lentzea sp. BCCO 10_0798]MDX8051738.1 cellulose binding domain-containing protein [Lentzea sp. BCCO 10_0798]